MAKKRKGTSKPQVVRARRRRDLDDDDTMRDGLVSSVQFWKATGDIEPAAALFTWIDRLRTEWVMANMFDMLHEAIYEDRPLTQAAGASNWAAEAMRMSKSAPANLNITRSMVDTATARLTKRRPMPVISADDAQWSQKKFARKMSRVIRRKMGSTEVEKESPKIIRDFIVRGTACGKVVRNGGDTKTERIPIYEVIADPCEAYYGAVRTLAHHRPVARDVLLAEFGDDKDACEAIEVAATFKRGDAWTRYAYSSSQFADHVEVAEGWHLPSAPGADDGCHVIAIRGRVLFCEPWNRPRFPISFVHWSPPFREFRGTGLVKDLTGIQAKVNDLCRDLQEGLYWGSTLKVFTQRGSNVNKYQLRNRHPVVIEYDGAIPNYVAPNPISNQAVAFLQMLMDKAYEISGISQAAASSKSTLGSNASGKALDTMEDIQSDRFAHVESGYMQFRVELGQCHIDEARAMYDEAKSDDGDLTMKELAPWIRNNDWSKCDIDGGDYHLTIEPINFLPDTRAGKLSAVSELSKAGLIPDPTMTADLFDEPDIAKANRTVLGPKHRLDDIMEGLADESIEMLDLLPDEYDNLALGVLMCKGEMKEAQANGADDVELARYRQWLEAAKALMTTAKSGMASPSMPGMQAAGMGASPNAMDLQPGLAGAGAPGGMPMPPPGPAGMM